MPVRTSIILFLTAFFLLRLIGITNPPLEVEHNWRQTTVAMVARNFVEVDANPLYPRIDIAGEKTGITGMEFPLLNYLIYLVSLLFGYEHWYGRLINLVVSTIGCFYFFKLIREYWSDQMALRATMLLTFSIWFEFSRKIMPDTFSMSLIIIALYWAVRFTKRTNFAWKELALFACFASLGVLSKIPSGYLLAVLAFVVFDTSQPLQKRGALTVAGVVAMVPAVWWYFYWSPHLVDTYGFTHFFSGRSWGTGIRQIGENLHMTLKKFYDTALKFSGFALFLWGAYKSVVSGKKDVLPLFLLANAAFLIIVFKSGSAFPKHSYYIIPFVPVMAWIAAYGLEFIPRKWAMALVVVVGIEGIANQQHDFRIKESEMALMNLENDLDKFTETADLVLINSGQLPTPMYIAHRKGWVMSNEEIMHTDTLQKQIDRGLQVIVILKKSYGTEMVPPLGTRVLNNDDYAIYRVGKEH
ncbi:MAG: glycosyltransferase family 39 protein [Flavobacteriales bacterium]|nr:glycosyltransferase family 39 protein [Flavobacteriales bacterium]